MSGRGEVRNDSLATKNESSRNEDRDGSIDSKMNDLSLLHLTHSSSDNSQSQSPNVLIAQAETFGASAIIGDSSPNTSDSVISTPQGSTPKSTPAPACPSLERVTNMDTLEQVANLYSTLIKEGRVSNLTSEIYFVIQLLTLSGAHREVETSSGQLSGNGSC